MSFQPLRSVFHIFFAPSTRILFDGCDFNNVVIMPYILYLCAMRTRINIIIINQKWMWYEYICVCIKPFWLSKPYISSPSCSPCGWVCIKLIGGWKLLFDCIQIKSHFGCCSFLTENIRRNFTKWGLSTMVLQQLNSTRNFSYERISVVSQSLFFWLAFSLVLCRLFSIRFHSSFWITIAIFYMNFNICSVAAISHKNICVREKM